MNTTTSKKSFRSIKNLIGQKKNLQINKAISEEISQKTMMSIALDTMQELIARKESENNGCVNHEELAIFVATQYAGIDARDLLNAYSEECSKTTAGDDTPSETHYDHGFNPTAQKIDNSRKKRAEMYFPVNTYSESLKSRKVSPIFESLDYLEYGIKEIRELLKVGMEIPEHYLGLVGEAENLIKESLSYIEEQKTIDMKKRIVAMEKRGLLKPSMVTEVLDPKDPAKVWIDDFVNSEDEKFSGKSKKERIDMALGAWYTARKKAGLPLKEMTSSEFDKTMEMLASSDSGEDIINAIEDENQKKVESLIAKEIKDPKKVKEMVSMIFKG